jgi:hypothetical protein
MACGNDDSSNDGNPTSTISAGKTTQPSSTSTNAATETPAPGAANDYEQLFNRFKAASFRADYRVANLGDSASDLGLTDPSLVIAQDGTGRQRFEITGKSEGQDVAFIIISNGADSGLCFKGTVGDLPITGSEDGACVKSSQVADQFGGVTRDLTGLEAGAYDVVEATDRSIAGQDASCYSLHSKTSGDQDDICIANDGGLLYFKSQDGTEFEATAYSEDVADKDFALPYDVVDVPGVGG